MIYLREICRQDMPKINQWRHDRNVIDYLAGCFYYANPETDETWFENYCTQRANNIRLAICLEKTNEHIGNVYLLNIDRIVNTGVFHIMLGETQHWRKGIGYAATQAMLAHGFNDQNLNRISLEVLATNLNAIKLYEKCGFQTEGTLKQSAYKNGQYVDTILMALLKKDYQHHLE